MNTPETLTQLFFDAVDRFSSKRAALRFKKGGSWHDITHHELARQVQHAALGMLELGIKPGDKIAIISANCPEWAIADYACLTACCADVPVYPTLPANQVEYILKDSETTAVFVQDRDQLGKVLESKDGLPALKHIVSFEEGIDVPDVLGLQDLIRIGAAAEQDHPDYRDNARAVEKDALATLIYTSGTTGNPKGVMLTHHNITSNVLAGLEVIQIGPDDSCLSLLPLSHVFERMAGHYIMLHAGTTINYAESIEQVPANMGEIRPTIVLSVPRLFEKIYARVLENAMAGSALKRRIFFWARSTAERWADLKLAGKSISVGLGIKKAVADKLVFSKLQARTGGRIRFFVSGGAPLSPEIARFFYAAGIPILEGYGLTETSPLIAVNPLESPRMGTVGPAVPGVEVRFAPDGELLTRGPHVMQGYYNKATETSEAIDADGWFHTGDIGEFDSQNYIKITDRKKDIIVTAGGKNIAPQPIENRVKTNKFILNAVMIGDKRKFPIMLVVPDEEAVSRWAADRRITIVSNRLLTHPDVAAMLEREVMGNLRDLASYEMPKKILIVEQDFTIDSGELTPTLKVKRNVVEKRLAEKIEELYRE
ncbi:MAG: long-chain fatty acid--CoA ligase [Gemmatimonadota bacterium]|nr:MAG: long-chain fatty acid--CoA ligase [Gemmatimonadota bacterium]